jgi:peptidoglycan/LPS O-acetylase OafA/YrhL
MATDTIAPVASGVPARVTLPGPALDHLNWLRGSAALAVLVGHTRGLFLVDYAAARPFRGLFGSYVIGGFGHEAVIVFFVLSGFFIATSVLGVTNPRPFSWACYLLNRFTRLYVVYLPALALTAIWDLSGMYLFGAEHTVYAGEVPGGHMDVSDVGRTIGLPTLLGNLAFLQDFLVRPYGSNGPLWSLSYEFWFYITFPLLVGTGGPWRRGAMAAAALTIIAAGGRDFLFFFSIWLMGALVAGIWPRLAALRSRRSAAPAFIAFGFFLGVLVAARLRAFGPLWRGDLALGLATSLFFAVLLSGSRRDGAGDTPVQARGLRDQLRKRYASVGAALAGCSYTLYLVHYPPLIFLNAWLIRSSRWDPTPFRILASVLIAAAVLIFYAYPLSKLTEAHTDRIRDLLGRALGIGRRGLPAHDLRDRIVRNGLQVAIPASDNATARHDPN